MKTLFVFCLSLLLLALPGMATAQEPQGTPTVNEVARDLYCPLCANLTVDVCELDVCADMRATIAERLAAGESPEEIQAFFVEQYGQKVLAKPATTGFDIVAWVMPFVALAGAGGVLFVWLRSRPTVAPAPIATPSPAPTGDYAARLDRELQRLDDR